MLKLVQLKEKDMPMLIDMMDEWHQSGEVIVPTAISSLDYHDYQTYVQTLEADTKKNPHLVKDSTYFCLDEKKHQFVGAVNIRHTLNEGLLKCGGHIGDGVRPSLRRQGIATQMIALALKKCEELHIEKVLMVCDQTNIGSAKSIMNNGGVLENEVEADGKIMQRYWIDLKGMK